MYKKLSDFEKAMCQVLDDMNSGNPSFLYKRPDFDTSIAIHQCIENGYIVKIEEWKDGNGDYHFERIGNPHLTQKGYAFLQEMSPTHRFKIALFEILKGTLGFILGVLSTVIAEIIILLITHPEEISIFLH